MLAYKLHFNSKKNHCSHLVRTVIFLLGSMVFSTLAAQSSLQKIINFKTDKTPIPEALLTLSEVADRNIAFSPSLFSKNQKISLDISNKSVEFVLKQILKPTNIIFKEEGDNLILYEKPKQQFIISGYIEDGQTGERLISATIWDQNSGKGTTTNDYGFFSFKATEGNINLQASYIGYQTANQTFNLSGNKKLNLVLKPSLTLQEIIVTDVDFAQQQAHLDLGKGQSVPLNELSSRISLGGESDIIHHLQTLGSVQSCLLYTSPSPRDRTRSRMPSSA